MLSSVKEVKTTCDIITRNNYNSKVGGCGWVGVGVGVCACVRACVRAGGRVVLPVGGLVGGWACRRGGWAGGRDGRWVDGGVSGCVGVGCGGWGVCGGGGMGCGGGGVCGGGGMGGCVGGCVGVCRRSQSSV